MAAGSQLGKKQSNQSYILVDVYQCNWEHVHQRAQKWTVFLRKHLANPQNIEFRQSNKEPWNKRINIKPTKPPLCFFWIILTVVTFFQMQRVYYLMGNNKVLAWVVACCQCLNKSHSGSSLHNSPCWRWTVCVISTPDRTQCEVPLVGCSDTGRWPWKQGALVGNGQKCIQSSPLYSKLTFLKKFSTWLQSAWIWDLKWRHLLSLWEL